MEFDFDCSVALNSDKYGMSIINANNLHNYSRNAFEIFDTMGYLSSKAQGLKTIITSTNKIQCSDNKLFFCLQKNKVLGFLKIGNRKLFIRNDSGKIFEIFPLCVLDFYVHESVQRCGIGKNLFELMLQTEQVKPFQIAYDRPSPKLLSFLRKHYSLDDYVPQNNNFVVFSQYFGSSFRIKEQNSNIRNLTSQENKYLPSKIGHYPIKRFMTPFQNIFSLINTKIPEIASATSCPFATDICYGFHNKKFSSEYGHHYRG